MTASDQDVERIFQLAVEKLGDEELRSSLKDERVGELPAIAVADGAEANAEAEKALGTLIRDMSIPQKIKLALFGNHTARTLLLRDTNRIIPMFVLENPRLTDNEIVDISRNTQVDEGILRAVGNNLQWMKAYQVKMNLVSNPKTPIDTTLRWLKFVKDKDLGRLAKSKNIPQVVSTQAKKLLEKREK